MKKPHLLFLFYLLFPFLVLGNGSWHSQNSGTVNLLRSLSFVDGTTGWAADDNGNIIHTADGGESWSAQSSSTFNWLWSMDFPEPTMGWICDYAGTIVRFVNEPQLNAPDLISPEENMEDVPLTFSFEWEEVSGATSYRLQISTTYAFVTRLMDQTNIQGNSFLVTDMPANSTLYWRVYAENDTGVSNWSDVFSFTTKESGDNGSGMWLAEHFASRM